jgi:uncharacterized membrane protein
MDALFYGKLYLLTVPIFFLVDMLWLGVIAKGFYQKNLSFILSPTVNWTAAIVFYLLYIVGILIFAVVPALRTCSAGKAVVLGLLFGFFTYATYDLTNLATVKDWPFKIVVVDILWGMFLCGVVSVASYGIGSWLLR